MPKWLASLMLALAVCCASAVEAGDRFVQDRIAIGFWVDPPAKEITDARYKEIADANFTFVIGNFGPQTPKDVDKQLALCKKYGLMAIVRGDLYPDDKLPNHPNCWGYHIVDEPGANAIPDIKKRIDAIRKVRPGKLGYVNLFPDYAPLWALNTASYDEHVERFAKESGVDVLSMDHYPMLSPTADGRDGYCNNLAVMRKYSVECGLPFWNFFNTMPFGPHYDPTESHIRWQIYTSLTYGAKGIMYFCYWSPEGPGGEFPKGGAIITGTGQRTRHYEQAKRINAGIKNLGPTLMKLTSTGVIRIKPTDDPGKLLENTPIKSITRGGDYLLKRLN